TGGRPGRAAPHLGAGSRYPRGLARRAKRRQRRGRPRTAHCPRGQRPRMGAGVGAGLPAGRVATPER
nr:hypothetical protein [Tanacetum cinerariifolium]